MIAIVEGRPAFCGDSGLYGIHTGWKYDIDSEGVAITIDAKSIGSRRCVEWSALTWTPPKPATISVNGVEVKRPIELVCDEDAPQFERYWISVTYSTKADAEAFKAAIEGVK